MSISPNCIARLTCEVQKRYWSDPKKKNDIFKERKELERRFTNLYIFFSTIVTIKVTMKVLKIS